VKRHQTILVLGLCACGDLQVGTGGSSQRSDPVAVPTTNAGSVASLACSPLDGRYTFSYSEMDGGCGPWANDTLEFENGRLAQRSTNGCAEGQVTMTDNCVLRIDSTCVASVDLGLDLVTQYVSGSIAETHDNRYASGTVQVTFAYASGRRCVGHYQVWANRNG
jgi:hypothetical protein